LLGEIERGVPPLARPDVPPELESLVFRALATDPRDRPASASELARELRAIHHTPGQRPPRRPASRRGAPRPSATRAPALLTCAAGLEHPAGPPPTAQNKDALELVEGALMMAMRVKLPLFYRSDPARFLVQAFLGVRAFPADGRTWLVLGRALSLYGDPAQAAS